MGKDGGEGKVGYERKDGKDVREYMKNVVVFEEGGRNDCSSENVVVCDEYFGDVKVGIENRLEFENCEINEE